jgi:ribosome-binding protein aMBF1 (putative translation factor)
MSGSKGHRLDNLQAQRVIAGLDIQGLAKKANVSDWMIRQLETGGNCEGYESQRIADALGVSLVTLGKKDL